MRRASAESSRKAMHVRFTDELRAAAEPLWRAQIDHPFVRGIGDGSLPLDRFRFWVRQDYAFLVEYCRFFALGAARAPDLETLTKFAELLHATAHGEMKLHRAYAQEFDIEPSELEAETAAPATRAYTDFLVRVAATGEFAEMAAALLPCMWAFSDIGLSLKRGDAPADARYARWIEMYSDPEFAALGDWCRRLVDALAEEAGPGTRRRMHEAFLTSVRYELAFWDMAWTGVADWRSADSPSSREGASGPAQRRGQA